MKGMLDSMETQRDQAILDTIVSRTHPDAHYAVTNGLWGLVKIVPNEYKTKRTSGWIKVTPDTMPPEGDIVMATVRNDFRNTKYVEQKARHITNLGWVYSLEGSPLFYEIENSWATVTHWMPYPAPAED